MDARIQDREALEAISPAALAAYARAAGWTRTERYGAHADVYLAEGQPEIVLPRSRRVDDYAPVVSRLLAVFAAAAKTDELAVYRDLATADRDAVHLAAPTGDGTVPVDDGIALAAGARNLLLAAAGSRPSASLRLRPGADRRADEWLGRIRFGLPEQDGFVVTVLTPRMPQPAQAPADDHDEDDVPERSVVRRLAEALHATRRVVEGMASGDHGPAAVVSGSCAGLCDALAAATEPFPRLDVSFSWAKTREPPRHRGPLRFSSGDVPILRHAARLLRRRGTSAEG